MEHANTIADGADGACVFYTCAECVVVVMNESQGYLNAADGSADALTPGSAMEPSKTRSRALPFTPSTRLAEQSLPWLRRVRFVNN